MEDGQDHPLFLGEGNQTVGFGAGVDKGLLDDDYPAGPSDSLLVMKGGGGAITMFPGKKSALDKLLVRVCQDDDELNGVVGKEGLGRAVVLGFGEIDGAMTPFRFLVTVL